MSTADVGMVKVKVNSKFIKRHKNYTMSTETEALVTWLHFAQYCMHIIFVCQPWQRSKG